MMHSHSTRPKSNRPRLLIFAAVLALTLPVSAADFVGSTTCRGCHNNIYKQLTNSIHSKMIRVNAHLPGVIHGDLRMPNAPTTNDVNWVMGGWYKEESYIRTNVVDGKMTYTVTQFEWNPIKGTYANNKPLRDWLVKCAGCHTTGYNPTTRTFKELNIGCEHCHGPGGDHALNGGEKSLIVIDRTTEGCGHCHIRAENAATAEFPAKTFNFPIGYEAGKPETLKFVPEALTVVDSFFPDGTSKRHRQQYLDVHYPGVRKTAHYEKGVTCTKCHDPHTSGTVTTYSDALPTNTFGIKIYDNVNSITNYVAWDGEGLWNPTNHTKIEARDLCKTCHTTVQDHHVHKFSPAALAAKVTCVDCHMPDVINIDSTTLRGALHPHTFKAMLPTHSVHFGPAAQPNSCTYRCHQGDGAEVVARALWADSIVSFKLASTVPGKLRVVGTPDYTYALEASADFKTWVALSTNIAQPLQNYTPRWGFEFSDPSAANNSPRFFRARQVQPAK